MKLLKRLAAIALAAALSLSVLTACGMDSQTGAEKEQAISKISNLYTGMQSGYTQKYTYTIASGSYDITEAYDGTYYYNLGSSGSYGYEYISNGKTTYSKSGSSWTKTDNTTSSSTTTSTTDYKSALNSLESVESGSKEVNGTVYSAVTLKNNGYTYIYCFDDSGNLKYLIGEQNGQQISIAKYDEWSTTCTMDLAAKFKEVEAAYNGQS